MYKSIKLNLDKAADTSKKYYDQRACKRKISINNLVLLVNNKKATFRSGIADCRQLSPIQLTTIGDSQRFQGMSRQSTESLTLADSYDLINYKLSTSFDYVSSVWGEASACVFIPDALGSDAVLYDLRMQIIQKLKDSPTIFERLGIMPQVQGLKPLAFEFLGVDPTPFIVKLDSQAVKADLLSAIIPKHLESKAALDGHLTLNLFFATFHFHLWDNIQDIFPVLAHDFQTASAIAWAENYINNQEI
uniref:Uncharacterized protein n=1 Tax=Romanomermis culicivorax TaxID=13658 RepID=A0A915I2N3_ROMCU